MGIATLEAPKWGAPYSEVDYGVSLRNEASFRKGEDNPPFIEISKVSKPVSHDSRLRHHPSPLIILEQERISVRVCFELRQGEDEGQ